MAAFQAANAGSTPATRTPDWKCQRFRCRLASLGDQIVWSFRGKKKFPIPLEAERKNFNHRIFEIETAEMLIFCWA